MAVTSKVYGLALQGLANKEIDFDTDTIKVLLATSSYAPNQDTHRFLSDVTGEVSGAGYSAGGNTLTSKSVTYDAATNTLKLSAANPSWPNSSLTARYAVFYVATGTAATSALLVYWDLGEDISSSSGPFDLAISAAGLLIMQAA